MLRLTSGAVAALVTTIVASLGGCRSGASCPSDVSVDPLADLSSLRLHSVLREEVREQAQRGRVLVLSGHGVAEPSEPAAEKLIVGMSGDYAVPIALMKPLAKLDRKQPFTLLPRGHEGCVAESSERVAVTLAMEGVRGIEPDTTSAAWVEAYVLDPTSCAGDHALLGAHPRVHQANGAEHFTVEARQLDAAHAKGKLPAAEVGFLRSHPDRSLEVFGSDASGSRVLVEHQLMGTWHPNGHVRIRCGDELERTFENAAFTDVFVVGADGRLYVGLADYAHGPSAPTLLLQIR